MLPIRADEYHKTVILQKQDAKKTAYLRYWGAIGDYYYLLTFITPMLRKIQDQRIVLAADVYPRYLGDPLLEVCQANGLIDELWTHGRKGAGATLAPEEYYALRGKKNPSIDLYVPGLYYDKWWTDYELTPYPIEELRAYHKMNPKFLIPIPEKSKVHESYPQLADTYITLQPKTIGKTKKNITPIPVIVELCKIGVQVVVFRFPLDRERREPLYDMIGKQPNIIFIDVDGPVDSLHIQAHAAAHVGVESSQILGAGIHDVKCFFFEYGGWQALATDIALFEVWQGLPFNAPPAYVRKLVESEL